MSEDVVWVECRACGATGEVADETCRKCDGNAGFNMAESEAPEPDEHDERWR
jgi:DnaJ-class molecular chaperone